MISFPSCCNANNGLTCENMLLLFSNLVSILFLCLLNYESMNKSNVLSLYKTIPCVVHLNFQ